MAMTFPGNPRLYKRQAILLSCAAHGWIYLFFTITKYVGNGENWFGRWQLILGLVLSACITVHLHYKWVMRIDAQYGKGSAWELKEVTVKLPVLRAR
jgi:hypothetical protein